MRLLVVGATGRTGRLLLNQAISRGHEVTALVRNATGVKPSVNLTIMVGDPRNADRLARLLFGHDVVISTLGQRSDSDGALLQDSAAAMVAALRLSGVRRCLVVSQGLLFPDKNPLLRLLRWFLARTVADSIAMESAIRASDTEWTVVRPPRLKEGGAPRGYASGSAPGPAAHGPCSAPT